MPSAATAIEKLTERAGSLYTLPAVAMEVVRLTSQQDVDTKLLKETIEGDPALTAKILRVVNSSMFGVSGEVGNLTQALALLGVRPLKLLVLGFSLPDKLFAGLAGDALRRYWTTALTRAVAARSIATDWFADRGVSDDDAFVAALLRDIGLLVLIQQLGEPYLRFLDTTTDATADPLALERESLGFDHVELSAALVQHWKLPAALAEAVRGGESDRADLVAQVVGLADLVTQLVGGERLEALPELLRLGGPLCGLDQPMVDVLVEPLQEQVDALAGAMRVQLAEGNDYAQVLTSAHAQMSRIADAAVTGDPAFDAPIATPPGLSDDELSERLLAEAHELRVSMRAFLSGAAAKPVAKPDSGARHERTEAGHAPGAAAPTVELNAASRKRLEDAIDKLAKHCRQERIDLTVTLATLGGLTLDPQDGPARRRLEQAIAAAAEPLDEGRVARLTLDDQLVALLMPGVDRRSAIACCQRLGEGLAAAAQEGDRAPTLHAGVASIVFVPNRFDPARLIEGATRCLIAAQSSAGGGVKSIEVY